MFPMLRTVLSNLVTPSATRLYPAEHRQLPAYRGTLDVDLASCVFCGACARACPSDCMKVDIKASTLETDPFACVYCGMCVDACPTDALAMRPHHAAVAAEKTRYFGQGEKKTKEQIAELRKRKSSAAR
jgi:ech hydrogenase subunit F